MKTAAKIMLILGIVFQFWLIFPLVIGILAYKRLDTAQDVSEIKGLGITVLLLVNLIAGILMLMMTNDDLLQDRDAVDRKLKPANDYDNDDLAIINNRILGIKKMKEEGIITEEEFVSMRANIVSKAISSKR